MFKEETRGPEEQVPDAAGAAPRVLRRAHRRAAQHGPDEPRQDRRVPARAGAGRRHRPCLRLRPVPDERRGRGRAARSRRAGRAHPHRALRHRAAGRAAGRRGDARGAAGRRREARIVIIRDGLRREIEFRKDQPSILDCASAAGLEVPFSCTSGVCGTCRAKLVEGEVRMERNFALDKNEVAAGFVLTCQAHPLTERVVLSFDETLTTPHGPRPRQRLRRPARADPRARGHAVRATAATPARR